MKRVHMHFFKHCVPALLVITSLSMAQHSAPEGRERGFVLYEAINVPSPDTTFARIDILYRIDSDFFVPVKNSDPDLPWSFVRRGELLVELIDTAGISSARSIRPIQIGSDVSDSSPENKRWHSGIVSLTAPAGKYTIVLEIDDRESNRKFLDRSMEVSARRFSPSVFDLSSPVTIRWPSDQTRSMELRPENLGGNILFGERAAIWVMLASRRDTMPFHVSYTLESRSTSGATAETSLRDSTGDVIVLKGQPKLSGDSLSYSLTEDRAEITSLIVPFPAQKLPLRRFELTLVVQQGTSRKEIKKSMSVLWPQMPLSLKDVDYALNALRYITREEELDSLKRGSYEVRRQNLETFWRARDTDTTSALSSVMAEYYRRVDYAARNFSTLRDPDGSRTDRGKIYILHGPPTKIERSLNPTAGFRESWSYAGIGKQFIFVDESKSGNYTLLTTRTL